MPERLRVVIYREDSLHVAQCVDVDIAAHGDTPEQAMTAFGQAYIRHIVTSMHLGVEPFADIAAPPAEFEAMWERGCQAGHERTTFEIPDFTVRKREPAPEAMTLHEYARAAIAVCA